MKREDFDFVVVVHGSKFLCLVFLKYISPFLLERYLSLDLGPTLIIQDDLLIPKFLTMTSANNLFPNKVTFIGFRNYATDSFFGGGGGTVQTTVDIISTSLSLNSIFHSLIH